MMPLTLRLIDANGRTTQRPLPDGDAGTEATVAAMRAMIDDAQLSPMVRKLAAQMSKVPAALGVQMLYDFLRRFLRFKDDAAGFEVLEHPDNHLRAMMAGEISLGDCDDHAIIGAAVLKAMGYRACIIVMNDTGKDRPFAHVFFGYESRSGVVPIDPQEGVPIGTLPNRGKRYAVEPV